MKELVNKRSGMIAEMEAMQTVLKNEKRSAFNADEKVKFEGLKSSIVELNGQIENERFLDEQKRSEVKNFFVNENKNENRSDEKSFDFGKVLRNAIAGKAQTGFEAEQIEATKEQFRKSGYEPAGNEIFIPASALKQRATNTLTTAANWVKVNQDSNLSMVRTSVLYPQMGVQVYSDLTGGKFDVPNLADITAVFATEDTSSNDISITPGKLTLSARFLPATASFSRNMLSQTSTEIQNQIMDAFVYATDKAIDKEIFTKISGLTASFTGNTDTYAKILQLEANLLDQSNVVFLSSYRGKNYWKSKIRQSAATDSAFVWANDNTVANYPAFASPQVGTAVCALFDPRQVAVGFWGGMILTVDPYSDKSKGNISIQVARMCDVGIINSAGFAVSKNGSYI